MSIIVSNGSNLGAGSPQIKSLLGSNLDCSVYVLAVALTYNGYAPMDQPLKDPVQDVKYLQRYLSRNSRVQFQALFESDATKENIINHFKEGITQCEPCILFVLYLAGHAENDIHGYEFIAYYETLEERANAKLNFNDLARIQMSCSSQVYVLQVRDTCFGAPNQEELQILENLPATIISASATGEESFETSAQPPHSLFLTRIEEATRSFSTDTSHDIRVVIADFFNHILTPIQHVNQDGVFRQVPQLMPERSQGKVISVH